MSEAAIAFPKCVSVLLDRLESVGFEAYLVGGCVRNALMGRECHDYDITTSALPEEIKQVFSDMRIVETGIKHGTVTVISEEITAEITTYRTDGIYTDRRHPQSVTFTSCLEEDLSRRDFTVNAIAYSEKRGIVDLFDGITDLKKGILCCVGEAKRRFDEDALRIMRGLRFMSEYGFKPEEKTAIALHEKKELLNEISAERINTELGRLLCGNSDHLIYVLREYWDILAVLIPEIADCQGFEQHTHYHDRDVWEHTIAAACSIDPVLHLRLTMLLHDLGKPAAYSFYNGAGHFKGHGSISADICRRTMSKLRFDNETSQKTLFLIERHDMAMTDDTVLIKKHLNRFGSELYFDLLKVHIADDMAKSPDAQGRIAIYRSAEEAARKIICENDCYSLKKLAINGNDIMKLGFTGKDVGRALDFLLNAVIEGKCANEKDDLSCYLEQNRNNI